MKEIKILGVKYTVEEVECVSKEELRKGEVNFLTCRILIDKSMPKEMKEQVLMHEIMHAVFEMLGYDDLLTDECKVQGISAALHQIFTDQDVFCSISE